jgi:hypothetical protein
MYSVFRFELLLTKNRESDEALHDFESSFIFGRFYIKFCSKFKVLHFQVLTVFIQIRKQAEKPFWFSFNDFHPTRCVAKSFFIHH